jgi:hypothetical protein
MRGTDLVFSYLGYQYRTWTDLDDDCIKIFHECFKDGQCIKMNHEFYDHSPYSLMTYNEFQHHVQTVPVFVQG